MAAVVLSGALSGVTEISVTAAAAVAIRPLPAGVPVSATAIAFPDAGSGWALGTDGGRTWRRLGQLSGSWPLSRSARVTLAVTGGKLAWASVFDQLSCAMRGCGVANVLSSPDGGRTWHTVHLPNGQPDQCGTASVAPLTAATPGTPLKAHGPICDGGCGLRRACHVPSAGNA